MYIFTYNDGSPNYEAKRLEQRLAFAKSEGGRRQMAQGYIDKAFRNTPSLIKVTRDGRTVATRNRKDGCVLWGF